MFSKRSFVVLLAAICYGGVSIVGAAPPSSRPAAAAAAKSVDTVSDMPTARLTLMSPTAHHKNKASASESAANMVTEVSDYFHFERHQETQEFVIGLSPPHQWPC